MAEKLLIDTDVLIDYLRGYESATAYLENLEAPLAVSVITLAELYAGIKGKHEQAALERFMQVFESIPLDAAIARLGGSFRREYGKSHGTGLADALIAATAVYHHAKLITLNVRHYPMVHAISSPYKKNL